MSRLWVTNTIETAYDAGVPTYVLSNLLTFGAPPIVLTILFFRISEGSSDVFVYSHVLVAVLLSSIGYVVWYYDKHLLENFLSNIDEIIEKESRSKEIRKKYTRFFREKYFYTLVIYGLLAPIAFIANLSYFQLEGVGAVDSASFWIYGCFAVWTALASSLGIHLVLTTLLIVNTVSKSELRIDPLHYDGLGGLGKIGNFCVSTMGIASLGALSFPYAFALARGGTYSVLVYLGVGTYLIILIGIFVYPTVRASQRAERRREIKLDSLRNQIETLEAEIEAAHQRDSESTKGELEQELRLQRLRKKYDEYSNVRLYPISVGTLTRFVGSVVLPLLFILLEFYLPKIIA